jgi:hypothetical protein
MSFLQSSHNAWLMSEAELNEKRSALLVSGQSVSSLLKAELAVSVPLLAALRSRHVPASYEQKQRPLLAERSTGGKALFDENVLDTATVFFKRYCTVHNITLAASPSTVFYTCLFVALKVEEVRLTVDDFVAKLTHHNALTPPLAHDVIAAEAKLLAALRFRLHIFHPFTALRGFVSRVWPHNSPEALAALRVVGANLAYDSALDHSLILPPALRAVAALIKFHHELDDDNNPMFDQLHKHLTSRDFLASCGISSLADPAFDKLRTLSSRIDAYSRHAARGILDPDTTTPVESQ